ncbi:hypothetical protein HOP50_15g75020 [Chloropicon primus]|uniref:Uncharacterized protein n=1 Tax=Chloropicon primus TaxID=1764295 RepID=A0A5B8MWM2_9CHLO|nr:hypothetical protein A3770_15p74770 [Chloropicon primus]UPR04168.1 hypothetical protein HOP50_15g75020 [Chloropicon primus]|mmetsp:Transcript_9952/g.28286  ORF Transcript_9952/g.28286 Transcript_9952/m.28286 type:complete len:247 (+) Transcript_9952:307-1047(+)|eukprot:QDZ24959.1 hypothetical protein A3770_15p74770 [Chloropicon primus]
MAKEVGERNLGGGGVEGEEKNVDVEVAEWSARENLDPVKDLGLSLGSQVEVLWDVSVGEGNTGDLDRVWWKGTLVSEETGRGVECGRDEEGSANKRLKQDTGALGFERSSKWRLKYQKYGTFEEETRTVVFLQSHLLVDLAEQQLLEWRKEGDAYEPPAAGEAGAEDEVVTIGQVTAEDEVYEEGLAELTKMPFDKQQAFASEYRVLADSFKAKLREILENKGEGYVVGKEDIHRMVEGIQSGGDV